MKSSAIFYWATRITAVVLMAQTLYFKFTGAEESVYIFTTVGMEPWGRIVVGVLELIASILILLNATAWLGAALALSLMGGALVMHLTILGIVVKGDNGQLFIYSLTVTLCSMFILLKNKTLILNILNNLRRKHREK